MPKKPTIYQRLNHVVFGNSLTKNDSINSYSIDKKDDVIFKTKDKEEYSKMLLQKKQQNLLWCLKTGPGWWGSPAFTA